MFHDVEWLFFDIGSTLIDERKVYFRRFQDIAHTANIPLSLVSETAEAFFKKSKKGDKEAAQLFGVPLPKWHSEDEELYPDTYSCLEQLHKHYKLGIIANQIPGTEKRLRRHNLIHFIDLVVASSEEGVAKPDKRIFEIALERSACPPQNAVMIGDRIDNDIIPAKQMGMKTIWIKQGYGKYWHFSNECEFPDWTVQNLSELCNILQTRAAYP